jgi:hypothetical protein
MKKSLPHGCVAPGLLQGQPARRPVDRPPSGRTRNSTGRAHPISTPQACSAHPREHCCRPRGKRSSTAWLARGCRGHRGAGGRSDPQRGKRSAQRLRREGVSDGSPKGRDLGLDSRQRGPGLGRVTHRPAHSLEREHDDHFGAARLCRVNADGTSERLSTLPHPN